MHNEKFSFELHKIYSLSKKVGKVVLIGFCAKLQKKHLCSQNSIKVFIGIRQLHRLIAIFQKNRRKTSIIQNAYISSRTSSSELKTDCSIAPEIT